VIRSWIRGWIWALRPASTEFFLRSLLRLVVFLLVTVPPWWLIAGLLAPFLDLLVTSAVSLGVVTLLSTAGMMRIYEMRPFYTVGFFANRAGGVHLAIGLALGAGCSLFIIGSQWAAGLVRMERAGDTPGWAGSLVLGFGVLLVGATGEELLFRGYAFQHLLCAFGPWLTITSTSVLFALAHNANPASSAVGAINTGLFGLVFGYAYWRTRDLWLPLGMHFAWNFSLGVVGANVSGLKIRLMGISFVSTGPGIWSGGDYGPEASLLTTLVLAGIGVFLYKTRLGRQEQGIPP